MHAGAVETLCQSGLRRVEGDWESPKGCDKGLRSREAFQLAGVPIGAVPLRRLPPHQRALGRELHGINLQ